MPRVPCCLQLGSSLEMDKYLQNREKLQPTEFVTDEGHARPARRAKAANRALTGRFGPLVMRMQQGRSSSASVLHADQELCIRVCNRF